MKESRRHRIEVRRKARQLASRIAAGVACVKGRGGAQQGGAELPCADAAAPSLTSRMKNARQLRIQIRRKQRQKRAGKTLGLPLTCVSNACKKDSHWLRVGAPSANLLEEWDLMDWDLMEYCVK